MRSTYSVMGIEDDANSNYTSLTIRRDFTCLKVCFVLDLNTRISPSQEFLKTHEVLMRI